MKNSYKLLIAILVIIVLIFILFEVINLNKNNLENGIENTNIINNVNDDSAKATVEAVVVEAYNNSLFVMGINNSLGLCSVGYKNENNLSFKIGQEVRIYYDGTIMETYPVQLGNVSKIEIIKEKSDVEIPESILKYCYSSKENVEISVKEITNNKILFTIKDSNQIPYKYTNKYKIYTRVKNENYTGVGMQIGENTENSIAGFTRNWK